MDCVYTTHSSNYLPSKGIWFGSFFSVSSSERSERVVEKFIKALDIKNLWLVPDHANFHGLGCVKALLGASQVEALYT